MTALQLDRLTVAYRRKVIFDGLSHDFAPGRHVILGANGTGKSTLLGAIAGGVPYRGRILIAGHEVSENGVKARQALAYVPDSADFYPFMTGGQFADFVLGAHGRGPASDQPRFTEILDRLGVHEHWDTRFGEASLGTRKKFFLVAALLLETQLLVMDEPFNGLDRATTHELIDLLNDLDAARTVVLTCHHPPIVEAIQGAQWRLGNPPCTAMALDVPAHVLP